MNFYYQEQLVLIRIIQGFVDCEVARKLTQSLIFFESTTYYFLLAVLAWAFFNPKTSLKFLTTICIGFQGMIWLKLLCEQPRPFMLDKQVGIHFASNYGFPSGGSMMALFLGFLIARVTKSYFLGFLYFFILSFSRIYLGAHFFTDVLGGWILGIILILFYTKWYDAAEKRIKKLSSFSHILLLTTVLFVFLFIGALTEIDSKTIPATALLASGYLSTEVLGIYNMKNKVKPFANILYALSLALIYLLFLSVFENQNRVFAYLLVGMIGPLVFSLRAKGIKTIFISK